MAGKFLQQWQVRLGPARQVADRCLICYQAPYTCLIQRPKPFPRPPPVGFLPSFLITELTFCCGRKHSQKVQACYSGRAKTRAGVHVPQRLTSEERGL